MFSRFSYKFQLAVVAAFCILPLFMTDTSFAQGKSPGKRVLIGFKGGTGRQIAQQRKTMVSNFGGEVHHSFHIIPVVSARLSEQAIAKLKDHPQIAYIEDDVIMHVIAQETPWGVNKIDAPAAWTTSRGAGVHVAILDTGIDYDHPDLNDNIDGGVYFAGWFIDEFLGKDSSTSPIDWDDGHGHGTHCAGIVAAEDNGIGVIGIAPEARLHAVKVLDDNGSGYTSDIVQGIEWCVDNNIDVASMSFGASSGTASLLNACNAAYSAGVLLVGAAGNDYGGPVIYPAAYDSVIAVSATDSSDAIASFSSIGPQVELAAPGSSIHSTYRGGLYAYMSGTSMACPHVSGTAALVIAAGISDVSNVRTQLRNTAIDLGSSGKDNYYGYGRVNAAAAVEGIDEPDSVVANFTGNPTSGYVPLTVDFIDQSTGTITSRSWDFGDGGTSTAQNPSHTYTSAGTYTVSLTVSGADSSDTETKVNYIIVTNPPSAPVADFAGSPRSGDALLVVSFTDLSEGDIDTWAWTFGDGGSSTAQNPSHIYTSAGTYTVSLTVTGPGGSDNETKTGYITVNPMPNIPPVVAVLSPSDGGSFFDFDTIIFAGLASDFEDGDLTDSIVWHSSINGNVGTGGIVSTTLSVGEHVMTASVTDSGGETSSYSITINVNESAPLPTPTLSVSVSTEYTAYKIGDRVYITVEVSDDLSGEPVGGAAVSIQITTPNKQYTSSATTNAAGVAEFQFKIKKPDGIGDYTINAEASISGYSPGSGSSTFLVD